MRKLIKSAANLIENSNLIERDQKEIKKRSKRDQKEIKKRSKRSTFLIKFNFFDMN